MRGRDRLLGLALAVALTATGCADDKVVTNTTTATSLGFRTEPGAPGNAAGATTSSTPGRAPRAGSYSAAAPPPAGFRDADLFVPGSLPLTARVDPGCVEHGQTLDIAARSRKGAYIRLTIVFPNDQFRDVPTHATTAGSSGTVTWSVKVTDAARTGEASLQVSARDPDTDELGTTGTWNFVVAAPGGCG